MTARRLVWSAGVVVAVLALGAAVVVASALPAGYDFRAYWLAGQHLLNGAPLYPGPDTILGLPDEFRYLPIVALLFIPFAVLPYSIALAIWTALQVATAAAVGIALIRQLPPLWRPWAAAGYVFFLGLVLEVTLGNVNLLSLGLALATGAVLFAIAAGIAARRDRWNENAWHTLTLATAGYLAPFGYFWTTFLILSLPLAAETLRRAATRPAGERVPIVALVVCSWVLMEPQQTGTLVPILLHLLGVAVLFVVAIVTVLRPAPSIVGLRLPSTTARTSQ